MTNNWNAKFNGSNEIKAQKIKLQQFSFEVWIG